MTQKFSDVARAELAADITDVATSFSIVSGGALFPVANTGTAAIGPGADWFKVTLVDEDGYETVYVRTHTSGSNSFSNVLRGQEGTTARAWNALHPVSGRRTVVGLRVSSVDFDRFEAKEAPITPGTTSQYWRGDKTWRDFATDVRAAVLTGLSTATNAVVTATDTVLQAIGKLQKQVTDHLAATNNPHNVTKSQVGLGNVDNVSAANLRDRSTHTGTQAASTITGLATVATTGSYNDLTDKPSIPAGTVTSVGISAPTGFSVSGSPVTGSGTLALAFASGYSLPTTAKQSQWDTAYGWGNHASAGYALSSNLAAVATTGSYNDLANKPSIPTLPATVSQAEAEAGTATTVRGWTALRGRQSTKAYVDPLFGNIQNSLDAKAATDLSNVSQSDARAKVGTGTMAYRNFSYGTGDPTGGANGDVYVKFS